MVAVERRFRSSPDGVFDALVDARQYPTWLVGARRVRVRDSNWPNPGASFDHRVGAGPIEIGDRSTVLANDPPWRLDLLVRARPLLAATVHFELHPVDGGTRLVMDERPAGRFRLLAPLIAPLVKLRNERSLRNLAALLDGGP